MNIDWSKAPEWAVAHGLHETGFGIKEFWLGETQHQNLEHAKSFPYGGGDPSCDSFHNSRRESFSYVTPRPAPWTGEGPPPIGTLCEFNGGAPCPYDPWHPDLKEGDHVYIIAYFNDSVGPVAAFTFKARNENIAAIQVEQARPGAFRPIKTPEQIAEEARIAELNLMIGAIKDHPGGRHGVDHLTQLRIHEEACIDLYDAGWRKQSAP